MSVPLVAVVIGFGGGAAHVVTGVAAVLLLVITSVALGQFLLCAFLNRLKSRKWRDLTMVLGPLVVGGAWVTINLLTGRDGAARGSLMEAVIRAVDRISRWQDWLLPLPSWWASRLATGDSWPRLLLAVPLAAVTA